MPVFNCEATLKLAIDSILKQTFTDFELIISDNCSTDSTSLICQEYAKNDPRIVYIKQPINIGGWQNFRFVLDQGGSHYFWWAAGDDVHSSDFLEVNIQYLETHADYVASTSPNCFQGQNPVGPNLVTFEIVGAVEDRFIQFFDNCWQSHGIFYSVFRKKALLDCAEIRKCLDKSCGIAMDWEVILSLANQGNIHRNANGLTIFGVNGISRIGNPWAAARSFFIEWIIPFYTFNSYVWKLSKDLPLVSRIKIMKRLLKFNLGVSYYPLYAVIHPILYPIYYRFIRGYLRHGKSNK